MRQFRTDSGLSPGEAEAFGRAALAGAPALARAYARLWMRASGASAAPRWRAPWPAGWTACVSWSQAQRLAAAALGDLTPGFRRRAAALLWTGRVRRGPQARTVARPGRPPLALVRFDGRAEGASLVAHELAHAVQMWAGPLASRPAPPLAAAEAHAHAAEGMALRRLARAAPRPAWAASFDALLAMLVRHPARAAFAAGTPWAQARETFAPALDWAAPPAACGSAETLYAYAAGAAAGVLAAERISAGDARFAGAYMEWVDEGPAAALSGLAGLFGARADDPGFYAAAYDIGLSWMQAAEEEL